MNIELSKYRQEKFNNWWKEENLDVKENNLDEFHRKQFECHKKAFLNSYIIDDPVDDYYFNKNRSIDDLKKEFDVYFKEALKPAILSFLNAAIKGSKKDIRR